MFFFFLLLLFLIGKWLQSSRTEILFYVSKWCTFVGMPVMCSDMFAEFYAWSLSKASKTRNWYPVIKGYVVVFHGHATVMLFWVTLSQRFPIRSLLARAADSALIFGKQPQDYGGFVWVSQSARQTVIRDVYGSKRFE